MFKFDLDLYISNNLVQKEGFFESENNSKVSFPDHGYNTCYEIEDRSFWFDHRNECITSLVKKYSKNMLFFDIGGGNGKVAKHLQNNDIQVVMIEAGLQGILNARKRGVKYLICGSLSDLNIKERSLPSIGMFDVLEHIERDVECLRHLYNYLQPQGFIYLTVPAYSFLWSDEDIKAGHFRRYTMKSLKEKLKFVGFEIVYSTYIFQYLILPIFLTRVLLFRLKIDRSLLKSKRDHFAKNNVSKLLQFLNKRELEKINHLKSMHYGGSILVVAKKSIP